MKVPVDHCGDSLLYKRSVLRSQIDVIEHNDLRRTFIIWSPGFFDDNYINFLFVWKY